MKDYAVCAIQIANATPSRRKKRQSGIGPVLSFCAGIILFATLAAMVWGV